MSTERGYNIYKCPRCKSFEAGGKKPQIGLCHATKPAAPIITGGMELLMPCPPCDDFVLGKYK